MREVALERDQTLHHAGRPVTQAWLPLDCTVSLLLETSDGCVAETGAVGCEGMAGASAPDTDHLAIDRCVVQVPGRAVVLQARDLRRAAVGSAALAGLLRAHGQAFTAQLARQVLCHACHPTEARLVRWLLTAIDRGPAETARCA